MPRPKDDFDTLYGYLLHEPADILGPDYMHTVSKITHLIQGLLPQGDLAEETEDRTTQWTILWTVVNQEDFVISGPRNDEPGYFGLHPDAIPGADEK